MMERAKSPLPEYDTAKDDSDCHSYAPTFNEILNQSTNTGGHFMFSHEKKAKSKTEFKEHHTKGTPFYIDAKRLSLLLSTVPFPDKFNLDPCIFNNGELEEYEQFASQREDAYRKYCENSSNDLVMKLNSRVCQLPMIEKNEMGCSRNDDCYKKKDDLQCILESTKSFSIVELSENTMNDVKSAKHLDDKLSMQEWINNL